MRLRFLMTLPFIFCEASPSTFIELKDTSSANNYNKIADPGRVCANREVMLKQNFFSGAHVRAGLIFAPHTIAQTASTAAFSDTTRARQYFAHAKQLAEQSQFDSSSFYFEKSRLIYASLVSLNNDLKAWEKVVVCWNEIGENYRNQARHHEALEIFGKAVETGLQKLGAYDPFIAASYDGIGQIYDQLLELERARLYYEKALTIKLQRFGENHPAVASSYVFLGNVYDNLGAREKGSAYLYKALTIRLKLFGENHLDVAASYHKLANLNWTDGDYDKALKYFEESRRIITQLLGENHPRLASSYGMIAMIYYCKGQYQTALAYCQKELQLRLLLGENNLALGPALVNIAAVYVELGEYDEALKCLYKSMPLFKKRFGEKHQAIATKWQYIGEVYLAKGDYSTALGLLNESLDMQRRFPNTIPVQVATLCYSLGELHAKQYNWERALHYYQKSILYLVPSFSDSSIYHNPFLRQHTLSEVELLKALAAKARVLAARYQQQSHSPKDLEMALSTYQVASDLMELMRNNYKDSGSRLFLVQKAVKIYEASIATALQAHALTHEDRYLAQAFYFAEKSKAAILTQSLQEARAKQFGGIPSQLLEKEKSLRLELANCETALQKEKEKNGQQKRRLLGQWEDRYFAVQRNYQNLINRFEKSYPRYYQLKYKTQTTTIDELQKALDANTALLEFFLGDSVIFAFVATKERFDWAVIKKDTAFTTTVASLSRSFKNVSSKTTYLQTAAEVYRMLVKPFATLSSKRRWVIIPDGDLYQIPFEALLNDEVAVSSQANFGGLPYLLKQHEISYHYSATLFLQSLQKQPADNYANLFVGFAPVFSEARKNGILAEIELPGLVEARPDASSYLITRDGKTLDELKYSERELKNIAAVFFNRGRVYLHEVASEENFKKNLKGCKYVHVATHGFVNTANPQLSNLAFSQPQTGNAEQDGILYSGETYNLDLNADLLVLSACQTGAGQIVKGEGLMALTRGFLYSGTRNIVASLWKVYDEHTSRLMVEFYRQIAADKSYSTALREAKLKMIANPETAAPQSWAGFVLIGQ